MGKIAVFAAVREGNPYNITHTTRQFDNSPLSRQYLSFNRPHLESGTVSIQLILHDKKNHTIYIIHGTFDQIKARLVKN